MRAGTEAAMTRVVNVFGAARPHHAYLFANRRANRMKVFRSLCAPAHRRRVLRVPTLVYGKKYICQWNTYPTGHGELGRSY